MSNAFIKPRTLEQARETAPMLANELPYAIAPSGTIIQLVRLDDEKLEKDEYGDVIACQYCFMEKACNVTPMRLLDGMLGVSCNEYDTETHSAVWQRAKTDE